MGRDSDNTAGAHDEAQKLRDAVNKAFLSRYAIFHDICKELAEHDPHEADEFSLCEFCAIEKNSVHEPHCLWLRAKEMFA